MQVTPENLVVYDRDFVALAGLHCVDLANGAF
jgi:hypothetical protein